MANLFFGRDRIYSSDCRAESPATPEDSFLHGISPFSQQLKRIRQGGLASSPRQPTEADYDEEKSDQLDPLAQFGSDRFERAERMPQLVSERAAALRKEDLQHAKL